MSENGKSYPQWRASEKGEFPFFERFARPRDRTMFVDRASDGGKSKLHIQGNNAPRLLQSRMAQYDAECEQGKRTMETGLLPNGELPNWMMSDENGNVRFG